MSGNDFEQTGAGGFPEMSESEKLAVRESFLNTVTDAIRRDGTLTGGHDKVHLSSSIGNHELILVTVGSYRNEQGPTGVVSLYRITGDHSGDVTSYEPDGETGYIIRREMTRETRRNITEKFLELLDDDSDDDTGLDLNQSAKDMVDDYTKVETMPGSEQRELPLVWPEEMQWLADVVRNAAPRR